MSTGKVHSTEVEATDTVATLKTRTTIALDYGECEVDRYRLRLYGTPGQLRFAHMIRQRLAATDALINREDVVVGASVATLPNGADYLLQPFKVYA